MSSGSFFDSNITNPLPIFLDHVATPLRINIAPRPAGRWVLKKTKQTEILKIPTPYSEFISDPVVYKNGNGYPLVNVGGRFALTSNGRRLALADVGKPLAHLQSDVGYRHQQTIDSFEEQKNQFADVK